MAAEDVTDLALREIERIARGVLPRTAALVVPVIERIAHYALRAREGRISAEQAENEIRRLGGSLRADHVRDR